MSDRNANASFAEPRLHVLQPFTLKNVALADDDRLVFIHPPKVAGTNLSFYMTALAGQRPDIGVTRFAVPRVPGQSPNLITTGWEGGLASARAAFKANAAALTGVKFISGHFPVGLHEMTEAPCRYMALIRHPVERELSAVNFDYQRGYVERDDAADYVRFRMIDNPQTRMLAGKNHMSGTCTQETLEAAEDNLDKRFLFVAPHHASFQVLQTLAGLYDGDVFAIAKAQVTGIKAFDPASAQLQGELENRHHYDMQLYRLAERRWAAWMGKHVTGEKPLASDATIMAIRPEFATTKKPVMMSASEIAAYNGTATGGLVSVSQDHSELSGKAAKPTPG